MTAITALRTATFLAVAVSAIGAAHAQATATPRTLSRDELATCMTSEGDLKARRAAIDARRDKFKPEEDAIRAEAKDLDDEKKMIREDEYRKQERFDRKIKAHNARIDAARGVSDGIRKDYEGLMASMNAYNQGCTGVAFRPEDKEAILKEREAAAKK